MVPAEFDSNFDNNIEIDLHKLTILALIRFQEFEKHLKNYVVQLHMKSYMRTYRDWETDRKSTRLNSSHSAKSRMPSSA